MATTCRNSEDPIQSESLMVGAGHALSCDVDRDRDRNEEAVVGNRQASVQYREYTEILQMSIGARIDLRTRSNCKV
jgi:hypothetical protein